MLKFEQDAWSVGVQVNQYFTNNGVYTSKDSMDALEYDQMIQMSGVGGHHHNGAAENAIKNVVRTARTMMVHV